MKLKSGYLELRYSVYLKGVKKVCSEVKLYSYSFSNNVSNDINVTGIL